MKVDELVAIGKGLADRARVRMLRSLLLTPQYLEELAKRLNLPLSTTSFHVNKLVEAGLVCRRREQYYAVFEIPRDTLPSPLIELLANLDDSETGESTRVRKLRDETIKRSFRNGVLLTIPTQKKKRLLVLEEIARRFDADRDYAEKDLSRLLERINPDYCLLRRLLVDEGFMVRSHGVYRRVHRPPVLIENAVGPAPRSPAPPIPPSPANKRLRTPPSTKDPRMTTDRKQLKREALEQKPEMGIFKIENRTNGKIFLVVAPNIPAYMTRHRFDLELGSHPNRELQADWKKHGPDAFTFEVLETIDQKDESRDHNLDELKSLGARYLKKLHPWDDRGYHDRPRERQISARGED
ncbi:MAG TPA: DUF2087 domain-containing protein [Candidatus Ozemobacteraceae bacterium]|nr:DUF2087 domain-containing protein [Candidatus Ozemobacteraceae bacterium]